MVLKLKVNFDIPSQNNLEFGEGRLKKEWGSNLSFN